MSETKPFLKLLIYGAGLDVARAAKLMGVSSSHLSGVINGGGLSEETADKLSVLLGVAPEVLYLGHYLEQRFGPLEPP